MKRVHVMLGSVGVLLVVCVVAIVGSTPEKPHETPATVPTAGHKPRDESIENAAERFAEADRLGPGAFVLPDGSLIVTRKKSDDFLHMTLMVFDVVQTSGHLKRYKGGGFFKHGTWDVMPDRVFETAHQTYWYGRLVSLEEYLRLDNEERAAAK